MKRSISPIRLRHIRDTYNDIYNDRKMAVVHVSYNTIRQIEVPCVNERKIELISPVYSINKDKFRRDKAVFNIRHL